MEIKKVQNSTLNPNVLVKVTEMGNITEIQYMEHKNNRQVTQMLEGGEQYLNLLTGEIGDIKHGESRKDNVKGLYKTFAHMRELINTNVTEPKNCRWITLTYAENMTDSKRLYEDFKKFMMRFYTYCQNHGFGKPEYISVAEPQGRGAWHVHLLPIWETTAPYIPNKDLANLWGFGFVSVKALDNVDNVGAYLTAYLGDIEVSGDAHGENIKEVEIKTEDGKTIKKKFIKGGRLAMYPPNFNMIRHSRGIKKPIVEYLTQQMAREKVKEHTLTFTQTYELSDDESGFNNTIRKDYYNRIRKV